MANANTPLPFLGKRLTDLGIEELYASPQEQYSHMHGRAVRKFRLSWKWRWDLVAYMLGWSRPVYAGDGTFLYVDRVLPDVYKPTIAIVKTQHMKHPVIDDWGNVLDPGGLEEMESQRPWLWANEVLSMQGQGRQSKTFLPNGQSFSSYPEAYAEISYEVRHYRLLTNEELIKHHFSRKIDGRFYADEFYAARFCSFHPQPQTLSMSIPRDGLHWDNDVSVPANIRGQKAANDAVRLKASVDIQLRWYGVPGVPSAAVELLGSVNDRTCEFHPPGHVRKFAPHTLIYLGFHLNTYRQATGSYVHDISYLMSHFHEGHQTELAFMPGGKFRWSTLGSDAYDRQTDGHINTSLYPERNFNELFRLTNLT